MTESSPSATSPTLRHLGSRSTSEPSGPPSPFILDTFPNPAKGPTLVCLESAELTSLCPVTGQPDFATVKICYVPNQRCVESKSLKLYLLSYRDHRGFSEEIVNRIADDLFEVLRPRLIRVSATFNARGGISIEPLALRRDSEMDGTTLEEVESLFSHYDASR